MKKSTKHIFIALCCLIATLTAQANKKIAGIVTNTNGMPIPGVSVTKKGETKGTVTNNDGQFTFVVENTPATLEFSYLGYESETVEYQDEQVKEVIELQPAKNLEQVAYGVQNKGQVTASVFTISGEEILSNRSSNLLIALQGRLPGLAITQSGGEPGKETFSAQIRGTDSPNSNSVLYIVDGIERDPSGIDPYDVESITVLKDGAATAMYGMRGSGGVLLIKTKTGFVGKSKISISVDQSIQSPTRLPKMASAYDYARMYNQRVANDTLWGDAQDIYNGGTGLNHSSTKFYTPYELERYQNADMTDFYPVRDMVDDYVKDFSNLTRVNMNFQGGSEMMRYYTSVGYTKQGGLFENESFDTYSYDSESKTNRFNFRTNLEMKLNESLKAWLNIGGYMEKINGPHIANDKSWNYVLEKLYETPNNAHNDLTPDGEVLVKRDKLNFRNNQSVYGYLNRTGSRLETLTRLGNTFGVQQKLDGITEGLSVTGQLTFDIFSRSTQLRKRSYEAYEVATLTAASGADSLGYVSVPGTSNTTLSDGHEKFFNYLYNFRGQVDYQRTFANKHDVAAMLMFERQSQQKQALLSTNYVGFAGRASYGYDNKYFGEVNFAYQASEQFAPGKRWGLFPSVALGWLVSNEDFLKDSKAISYLKLRASAGQTGNSIYAYGVNNQYLFLTTWNSDASEDQIGNPNIQWETSTKYNLGVEAELFNVLFLGVDYFHHVNTDIIVDDIAIIPNGMMGLGGASLPPGNVGESVNKGFEIVLAYNKAFSKDLSLNINGSVSFNENEFKEMAELPYDDSYAYAYRKKGYTNGHHWGYLTDGLFQSQTEIDGWADQSALGGVPIPGDIKYKDITNDGVVDEKDRAPLAAGAVPGVIYGLRTQLNYKWFDLNVFIDGMADRNIYLHGYGRWSNRDNFTEYMTNAWSEQNISGTYPRLGNNSTNFIKSDYWIEDGAYMRLRNIELGFTLPKKISNKINASSIRFYANGLNLLTFDSLPNEDFDPETSNGENTNYPIIKAYNFGVSVKF